MTDKDEYDILDEEDTTPKVSRLEGSHPDRADAITSPKDVLKKPGLIHTTGTMVLHTQHAHRLFYGRRGDKEAKQHLIVGLTRFAFNVHSIWKAAAADDPYADLILLDIENAYDDAIYSLGSACDELKILLESMDTIEISISQSIKPIEVSLNFAVPWGFKGANLLARFDELVKLCLTACHVGLLMDDEWRLIAHDQRTLVRKVYTQSTRWMHTGVTRNDMAANNKIALRALTKYGNRKIPKDVLKGERRASLAPAIRIKVEHSIAI